MNKQFIEYLDILDIHGNKTGIIKERNQAKKDSDIYKIIYLWIINNKNEVLLQKRSLKKQSNKGKWDCAVSGHVLAGESSLQALKREAKEELNLELNEKDLTLIYSDLGKNTKYEYHDVYVLKKDILIEKLIINKDEIDQIKYFNIIELIQLYNKNLFANDFHNQKIINIIKKEINKRNEC